MNITIDSNIQNIIMRLGGVDYPISKLKLLQNGNTPVTIWEEAQPETCEIIVYSNNDAYGGVSGGGTYELGDTINLYATAYEGCVLDGWHDDNGTYLGNHDFLEIEIDSAKIAAGQITYWAEFSQLQQSTVTAYPNDSDYGSVDGNDCTYYEGDTASVEAFPEKGYGFEGWYENGTFITDETYYEFEIHGSVTLEAVFYALQTYNITLTVNDDTYGYVNGGGTYLEDETVNITANKNTGYKFVGWYENGDLLSSAATYDFTVDSDRYIEAVFAVAQQFLITCLSNDTSMGAISGSTTVYEQDECLLEAINEDGYAIDHWEVNGTTVSNSSYYRFYPTANTTVTAIFTQDYNATEYFTIEPQINGSIKFTKGASAPVKTWYYSTNKTNWTSFNKTTTINVSANTKYYFYSTGACGTNSTIGAYWTIASPNIKFSVSGNILSLYKGSSFSNKSITHSYALVGLFYNSVRLVSAKNLVIDFTATPTYQYIFSYLFFGCSNLTIAPKLPTTSLTWYCYRSMLQKCSSLTTAPDLPATTLQTGCYQYMFNQCSNLNYIKCLATSGLTGTCNGWVNGVAASGTFVKAASVSWSTGVNGIPSGWTVENA